MIKSFKIFEQQIDAFADQDISINPADVKPREKRKYSPRYKDDSQGDIFRDFDPSQNSKEDFRNIVYTSENYEKIEGEITKLYKSKNRFIVAMMQDIVDGLLNLSYDEEDNTSSYDVKFNNMITEVDHILKMIYDAIIELEVAVEKRYKKSNKSALDKYKRKIIKEYLSILKKGSHLIKTVHGWKEFITDKLEHAKYEESFMKYGGFSDKQTSLRLGKVGMLGYVLRDEFTKDEMIKSFNDNIDEVIKEINENTTGATIKRLVKADLVANEDIGTKKSLLVSKGEFIEVKNKKYNVPHNLSEFYSIGKASKTKKRDSIVNIWKKDPAKKAKYEEMIGIYYDIITNERKADGERILNEISNGYAGILFASNIYVPTEGVELFWNDYGQRKGEKRLSIWHKVKDDADKYYFINRKDELHFNPFSQ